MDPRVLTAEQHAHYWFTVFRKANPKYFGEGTSVTMTSLSLQQTLERVFVEGFKTRANLDRKVSKNPV